MLLRGPQLKSILLSEESLVHKFFFCFLFICERYSREKVQAQYIMLEVESCYFVLYSAPQASSPY